MNPDAGNFGFGHFILQADAVGKTLLTILMVMSVASWAIIAMKGCRRSASSASPNARRPDR